MARNRVARSILCINGALAALFLFGCGIRPDVFDRASEAKASLSYTSSEIDEKLGAIPVGGTTGQALIKSSATDYATEWGSVAAEGDEYEADLGDPLGDGYILSSTAAGVRSWVAPAEVNHDAVTLDATIGTNLLGLTGQELSLDTQTANYFFAGPASGAAAVPDFRAMEDADIPAAIARDTEIPTAADFAVDDLITLSGVASGVAHLGEFDGALIPDSQTIKSALQTIETGIENRQLILSEGSFANGDKAKLDGIAEGAQVNPGVISQAEAEAGTATTGRLISGERLAQAITALTPGISDTKGWDYTVLTEAPTGDALIAGKVYRADNDTWDPITYTGPAGSETVDYMVQYTSAGTWIGVIDLLGNLLVESLPADIVVAATIDDGVVLPVHLDASDAPADGEIPVYNLAGTNFTWVAASEGGAEANNLESVCTGIATTEIFIGTGAGTGNYAALSGAVTMTNAGVVSVANDYIDSAHYAAGSIDNEHLAANSVDSDQYVDGSIDPAHVDKTAAWDFGGASTFEIPNSAANDATLAATGQVYVKDTDSGIAVHLGSNGEVAGEVFISAIKHKTWSFDPEAVCDGAVDRLFLMSIGPDAPNGIIIDKWSASFEADPTTEADLDLKYADAFIGVANAAVIDVLDTTAGASAEDTDANINGGAAVANGKVMYLEFGTPYTESNHQIIFELFYHMEED